jgi:hypothetical protein
MGQHPFRCRVEKVRIVDDPASKFRKNGLRYGLRSEEKKEKRKYAEE